MSRLEYIVPSNADVVLVFEDALGVDRAADCVVGVVLGAEDIVPTKIHVTNISRWGHQFVDRLYK